MLKIIIPAVTLLLCVNTIMYLAGGYFMLFRTALNDALPARRKLGWMWVQTILPVTSLIYAGVMEKNRKMKLLGILFCAVGVLAAGSAAMNFPWLTIEKSIATAEANASNLQKLRAGTARDGGSQTAFSPDSKDPLTAKVGKVEQRLKVLAQSDSADMKNYSNALLIIDLTARLSMKNSSPEAQATLNPKLEAVIDSLNARLDKGPLTDTGLKQWTAEYEGIMKNKR